MGPISVDELNGSPSVKRLVRSTRFCVNSSTIEVWTNTLVPFEQTCPDEYQLAIIVADTALSRSQSSNTIMGLFPPNSIVTFFISYAACWYTFRPVDNEPVNDTLEMSGWPTSVSPVGIPPPKTTLNTPSGTPASMYVSAKRSAVNGVSSDGLNTMEFPNVNAGADFQIAD